MLKARCPTRIDFAGGPPSIAEFERFALRSHDHEKALEILIIDVAKAVDVESFWRQAPSPDRSKAMVREAAKHVILERTNPLGGQVVVVICRDTTGAVGQISSLLHGEHHWSMEDSRPIRVYPSFSCQCAIEYLRLPYTTRQMPMFFGSGSQCPEGPAAFLHVRLLSKELPLAAEATADLDQAVHSFWRSFALDGKKVTSHGYERSRCACRRLHSHDSDGSGPEVGARHKGEGWPAWPSSSEDRDQWRGASGQPATSR